jgi:hypothetical protein
VAGLRRRNLAISFGILLLLALSMALIIVYARRAQRLAQLQIDFVAGISPENSGRSSNVHHRYTALSSELAIFMPPWSIPWGAWATLMS